MALEQSQGESSRNQRRNSNQESLMEDSNDTNTSPQELSRE